ncbi:MAG TPA: NAD-dependent epimerase/dehydratase family protein [Acidimicrobiales bacterium]|jgi:nucleoside-diphosphate-sugar epimerase|nr:NAD-dependent epimerase/dehydratase family protein [Acidimicrobiales bacterium]
METVVITGADSPLGRRVATLAATDAGVDSVIALCGGPVVGLPDRVDVRRIDLGSDDVKPHLEGAAAVLHLATSVPASPTAPTQDVERARRVFDAAGDAAVPHLVVLSSATVYGAWANNPVPLTEEATLRPNPGFAFAAERAEIERLASEWRDAHPGAVATVFRPARTAGADRREWLVPALRPGPAVPETAEEPPVQFLDLDDLASAIDLGRRRRLSGAFNVAPDGSVPGDQVRSLTGAALKVPLPERVAGRLVRWGFRWGLGPTPPELVPYTLHPWTVANDRLRAQGWSPKVSNEEACVDAFEAGAWATMSPRRRQEIALGVAGAGLAGVVTGGALLARRWIRSRR